MSEGFWKGVVVAVLAGGIIWGGSEAWNTYRKDRARIVTYEVTEKPIVINSNLKSVIRRLDEGNEIAFIRLRNDGREDLAQLKVRISDSIGNDGSGMVDFGILEKSGERTEEPKLAKVDGSIDVTFPILRPDEGVRIWIANKGYSIFQVSNSQPSLKLEEGGQSPSFWESSFFLYILIGIGAFVLGLIASEALNRHVLRRIGFDPDEVTKLYVEAEKKKGGK